MTTLERLAAALLFRLVSGCLRLNPARFGYEPTPHRSFIDKREPPRLRPDGADEHMPVSA